jgi:hypothetical protein
MKEIVSVCKFFLLHDVFEVGVSWRAINVATVVFLAWY